MKKTKAAAKQTPTTQAAPTAPAPTVTTPAPAAPVVPVPMTDAQAVGGPPPKVKKEKVQRPVCGKPKKDGEPCTARCKEGADTCVDHQPVMVRLTETEQAAWVAWLDSQDAATFADLLGWHKVKDLIGSPVGKKEAQAEQAAA